MTKSTAWTLSDDSQYEVRVTGQAAEATVLMPKMRLRAESPHKMLLSAEESSWLVLAVSAAVMGHIPRALYYFEQLLLPQAGERGPTWHGCVLLWSVIFRLLACDTPGALSHITQAEQAGLVEVAPELMLLKGMALRLSGNCKDAAQLLKPIVEESLVLSPDEGYLARVWYIESKVAGGLGKATIADLRWMQRQSRGIYHNRVGSYLAAIYRLRLAMKTPPADAWTPEDLLEALDQMPFYERPMLTMLLEDILPRPLRGVVPRTKPVESYWE